MIKNLKKVISAIAALAISASSIAAFAVNFPDVEEGAYYAQAVQELSALGVISGVEEGGDLVFKPDDLVTRAEMAKMVVDAKGQGNLAEAAAGSSKFIDVNNAGADGHWARGYINQGVADGWINGYSDTEFGPDDNVTYVQAQRMLVSALGYDSYAQSVNAQSNSSDWSVGYQQYAGSLHIVDGVQGVTSRDQQVTRAQVAQMIDNAMDAPITKLETYAWGYPVFETLDRTGKNYQTMFTTYHDAYKVYGRVEDTSKTGNGVDNDQVRFKVERADNFDDVTYTSKTDEEDLPVIDAYFGDTNAPDMLRTYAQALIQKDDNDEFTILSITAAASNKEVTVAAEDVDDKNTKIDNHVIYFYPAGQNRGSVRYSLADEVRLYVNGVEIDGGLNEANYEEYIFENEGASVTLQSVASTGSSSSSKYNVVMITDYTTAVVDQIIERSSNTAITFMSGSKVSRMTVDPEDENITYNFKLDGEEIDVTDLQQYDVLNISYDSTRTFSESAFYDVIVTRDSTAEGKYSGVNSSDEYTFGGEKYKLASGNTKVKYDTSTEYMLYLDHFGKVAYAEEISNTKKVGILKNVYSTKGNTEYVAEVLTKDGTSVEYSIAKPSSENEPDLRKEYELMIDPDESIKTAWPKQVIEYKTTSAGKITITVQDDSVGVPADRDDALQKYALTSDAVCDTYYRESSSRLGGIKVSDSSVIIDISSGKDNDIKVLSKDNLKDGQDYDAEGFDKSSTDSSCRFIVLTNGIGGIDVNSQLAIFIESGSGTDTDGNEVDTMTLFSAGEEVTLNVDEDSSVDVDDYKEGDAILYSTTSDGNIDDVMAVTKTGILNSDTQEFEDFRTAAFANDVLTNASGTWDTVLEKWAEADEEPNIYFGAVVDDGGYVLGKITDVDGSPAVQFGKEAAKDNIDLTISNDTKIYVYDFSRNPRNAGRLSLDEGMLATPNVSTAYNEDETVYFLDNVDVEDSVVFAVARTFNEDDVQEIYLIINE